jgi:curved DNA-binding protein CbpA
LLSIEPGATQSEIRSAYRAALKLCHPDRVANLDPEIQDLAHRKAKALRHAYESLLKPR